MSRGEDRVLTEAEKLEWLHGKGNIRRGPHQMNRKVLHWRACTHCGLLSLRNRASALALAKQCEWEE